MRPDLWNCGCRPCCRRLSFSSTLNSSTELFEPFDYWAERHHEVVVEVTCSARPAGDTTSSPYLFKPVTVDALLWCDNNAQNEAARLRLRVEHGGVRSLENGTASTAELTTHAVSCRDNVSLLSSPKDVVELRVFLEYVTSSGLVSQSVQVNPIYSNNVKTFSRLSLKWDVWYLDDKIYAAAFITAAIPSWNYSATSLSFPQHIFTVETPASPIQNNRFAVHSAPVSLVAVSSLHYAKRAVIQRQPCIPSDTTPYCQGGELSQEPSKWPFKHSGDCTAWNRATKVIGAPCSSNRTGLRLTIPVAVPEWGVGPYGFGMLIDDTYELANAGLANSLFWFNDEPNKTWTKTLADNVTQQTFTLKTIEISATVSCNAATAEIKAPCVDSDWPATISFFLSTVIEVAEKEGEGISEGDAAGTYRVSYAFSAVGGVNFLNGSQVAFRPYGTIGGDFNAFKPTVGPFPFIPSGIFEGLASEVVSYGGPGDDPDEFTTQLV